MPCEQHHRKITNVPLFLLLYNGTKKKKKNTLHLIHLVCINWYSTYLTKVKIDRSRLHLEQYIFSIKMYDIYTVLTMRKDFNHTDET